MKKKMTMLRAIERARRNFRDSTKRLEDAQRRQNAEELVARLKKEMADDEKKLEEIQTLLEMRLASIPEDSVRRVAEDHYLREITISGLAKLYDYSESTIKRHLKIARKFLD